MVVCEPQNKPLTKCLALECGFDPYKRAMKWLSNFILGTSVLGYHHGEAGGKEA
jgi:hypothetical protein